MRRAAALALCCLAPAVAGCGKSAAKKTAGTTAAAPPAATPATATTAVQPKPAAGCRQVPAPKAKQVSLSRPSLKLDATKSYTVTLKTSCGDIGVLLDVKRQPKTAASFVYLVRKRFYDGLVFHRIALAPDGTPFVIQGGDPLGTGSGDPGYSATEAPPRNARYLKGTVAMAKTEIEKPGTSGSQFYIVTAQDAGLPPDYAVLGRVVSGQAAVATISGVDTDPSSERPLRPVVIEKATVAVR